MTPTRLLPLLALSLLLSGCGDNKTASTPSPSSSASDFKVALLTPGRVNDGGWNQLAFDGLNKVKADEGAEVSNQESLKPDQFENAMRDYAGKGYKLVFAHGFEFGPAAMKVAPSFPNTTFVVTGGDKANANVATINFKTGEGTYLQGMEAAMVSKTGKGGFVGGQDIPPVKDAVTAMQNGAKSVNPKFDLKVAYINSWDDPAAAKAQTDALLTRGADVIAHNCDAAAAGLFQTAGEKPNVYTFGVNNDENAKAPNVLSSVYLNVPKAFSDVARDVKAGTFKGGALTLGIKEGDILLKDNPKFANVIPAVDRARIDATAKAIAAGTVKVGGA